MAENEYEMELFDFLNVIWKKRWLIVISTFLLAFLAGLISFLLPQKWEVDALIQPAKYLIQTADGKYDEVEIVPPKQIANQIAQAVYNPVIADELNIDLRKFPKIKAVNLQDTNLVLVSIKEKDVEKAKLILHTLFKHLKNLVDNKLDVEMKAIDYQIKSKEIEKSLFMEEIKSNKIKLNIVSQRIYEIEKELGNIRKRVDEIEKEQHLILNKDNRSEVERLALQIYSNEIQQSLMNYNTLNELLGSKKIAEENINLNIEDKEKKIKQLDNEIINLNERKRRLDYSQLIKEPTPSPSPVSPKKKLNIAVAGILGLILSTMIAFFIEYIETKNKKLSKNQR